MNAAFEKLFTRRRLCAVGLALEIGVAACGKRGAPQAPIRPVPGPVTQVSARRVGDRVELHFAVPLDNSDASTPPVVGKVEIYGAPGPPILAAAVPVAIPIAPFAIPVNDVPVLLTTSVPIVVSRFTPVQLFDTVAVAKTSGKVQPAPTNALGLMQKKHLRGAIEVRPLPPPLPEGSAPPAPEAEAAEKPFVLVGPVKEDPRPQPGWSTTFTEQISAERTRGTQGTDRSIFRYVIVPLSKSKRRGPPSQVLEFPLGAELSTPSQPKVTYDSTTLTLTWTPGAPAQNFRIYKTDPDGKEQAVPLNASPLTVPTYTVPVSPVPQPGATTTVTAKVEFDEETCFSIRAVQMRGPASIESDAAGPLCVTPVDTFPPNPPTGLSGLPTTSQIQLMWTPVTNPDLAGYIVLRAESGSAPKALMEEPVTETSYTDATVRAGARYSYVVIAVDKAGNRSQPSNQIDEIR